MSPSEKRYLALRQSLDEAEHHQYSAPDEDLEFRTVNKSRECQNSTPFLITATSILLVVAAIQTVLLIRSSYGAVSKSKIISDWKRPLN